MPPRRITGSGKRVTGYTPASIPASMIPDVDEDDTDPPELPGYDGWPPKPKTKSGPELVDYRHYSTDDSSDSGDGGRVSGDTDSTDRSSTEQIDPEVYVPFD